MDSGPFPMVTQQGKAEHRVAWQFAKEVGIHSFMAVLHAVLHINMR